APADLDHVAEYRGTGRLADDAGVEGLAAATQPVEHLLRAVLGGALFVAGDQEADRAPKTGAALAEKALGGADKGGDRPFHVARAAAVGQAVAAGAGKRRRRPGLDRPGRPHVGVAGKAQIRPAAAETGVEIVHPAFAVAEGEPVAGEAEPFERRRDDAQGTFVLRGDARPADQLGGQGRRFESRVLHSR